MRIYFSARGRKWLARQPLPDDERGAIDRHVRELDPLAEDLDILDREIALDALDDQATKRLMTITGVNLTVARWKTRSPSDGVRERFNPARQE
jgi:transposase